MGVPLTSSSTLGFAVQPNSGSLPCAGTSNFVTHSHHRQRTRSTRSSPNAPRIHPVDSAPEGVPSSLFTFRPNSRYAQNTESDGDGDGGIDDGDTTATAAAVDLETHLAGLVEESDLADVSELLVEVFQSGVVLADGDFSELESVIVGAPLEMVNKYMRAVAYNEIYYALKSRCGKRLAQGDFSLTSDALVLAVRDRVAPAEHGGGGDVIAVVELSLRKPDGTLPTNWPFPSPWRSAVMLVPYIYPLSCCEPGRRWEPYMCNLAVAKRHRGKGYGKQLVRLCEHIAKNHWGYKRMHLHVDMDDPAATGLYSSLGYKSMEQYDTPLWIRKLLSLPTIRYQVKEFKGRRAGELSPDPGGLR
eukprot:jgi/Undpi1/11350/HiC_scaffold_30.g13647.m1